MSISKILIFLGFLVAASAYSRTLEFREFTVRGDLPATGSLTKDQNALFDKGLIAFNQSLSLPIPANGEISYRDTKNVPYVKKYDEKGVPKEMASRKIGMIFTGHVKKKEGQYEISFNYNHTSLVCNITKAVSNGTILYLPEFQSSSVESDIMLYHNKWFMYCWNPKSKETIVIALKFIE